MTGYRNQPQRLSRKAFAAVVASGALLATGCSNMATTAVTTPDASAATLKGRVHGGNQPVTFANVYLYAVGQSGLGSAPTQIAQTTTDASGDFSFIQNSTGGANTSNTYSCASLPSGNPDLYILARGGNTQGTSDSSINNSAAVFMAPLGSCANVNSSTVVDITEVTTVATVAALAQYINPSTDGVGADGISSAINSSFALINNLVNQTSGAANTTLTLPSAGANAGGAVVTATPESAKLNTIANIISACVNETTSAGTACTTLFSNATPPANASATSQPSSTFPAATDVVQAALYMFLNGSSSTTNLTNLYNLSPATGAPYQPTITTAPTDWSIAIAYTSSSVCGGTPTPLFATPYEINVDAQDNVWLVNNNTASTGGALVELTPSGNAAACVTGASASRAGGFVDSHGNIWYDDLSNVYEYVPSTNALTAFTPAIAGFTGSPLAITGDGSGNVYFSTVVGSGGNATGYLYKIVGGLDTVTIPAGPALEISNQIGPYPVHLFPDKVGDIWSSAVEAFVSEVSPSAGVGALNGYTTSRFTTPSGSYGITVDENNLVYVGALNNSLTVLQPTGDSYGIAPGFPTPSNIGGMLNPLGVYLDGAKNTWLANNLSEANSGPYGLSVISSSGAAVSPATGFQKPAAYFNAPRSVAIDNSGNVWTTSDAIPNGVTETVGAAVPIYQPYSVGLSNGRFQEIP